MEKKENSSQSQMVESKKNSKKSGCLMCGIVLGAILFLILIISLIGSCNSDKTPKTTPTATPTPSSPTPTPTSTPTLKYTFDVSSLVGKNIDEIRTILGEPIDGALKEPTQEQISLGANDFWQNTFKKDGKELLITFNPTTRKITDFFISTDDPSGKTKDKAHLLELGNLKENDSNYKIEFVKALKYPDYFTGIKIIPNK